MYTIGQLAGIAGISTKALRIYEKKGLLEPIRDPENSYRKYGEEAKLTLQKIMMLKFLGFSLDQIQEFIQKNEGFSPEETFNHQKQLLEQKKRQLETAISCIDTAICECQENRLDMDKLFRELKTIQRNRRADEMVWELTKYSSGAEGWNSFIFDQADLHPGQRILDAGAGWGGLWRKNWGRIPEGVTITCIDKRHTWADTFEAEIREMVQSSRQPKGRFSFLWGDMEQMDIGGPYDRIFLNHTAPYIKEGDRMLRRFADCLTENGMFICTWGGSMLHDQLSKWLAPFAANAASLQKIQQKRTRWLQQWEQRIHAIFPLSEKKTYKIELHFKQPEECFAFIMQYMEGMQPLSDNEKNEIFRLLHEKTDKTGTIHLQKDTLLYCCKIN